MWEINSHDRRGQRQSMHVLRLAESDAEDVGVASFWQRVCDVFGDARTSQHWDTLILSIRPNSGRIIGFQGLGGKFVESPVATVWVKLPAVEAQYYLLPNAEDDLEGFEAVHQKLVRHCVRLLREAVSSVSGRAALAELRTKRQIEIVVMEYDDVQTAAVVDFGSSVSP